MTLIVTGGRGFKDDAKLCEVLTKMNATYGITLLVQGGCSGADKLAVAWAEANGIRTKTYKANWFLGKRAGPKRNQEMIDAHPRAYLLALPGGKGTADMVERAKKAGMPVCGGYEEPKP